MNAVLSNLLLAAHEVSGTRLDFRTNVLLAGVIGLLLVAWAIGRILKRQPESTANPAVVRTFNLRVRAWLLMFAVLVAGFVMGKYAIVGLFGLISFWGLREFITMTPTRRGDHRTLFWTFFLFTPLQYVLVSHIEFYGLYTILIPVYASLIIPARIALSGDPKRFLERAAKIQSALLICVYSLSHAPALLTLELSNSRGQAWVLGAPETPAAERRVVDDSGAPAADPMPMPEDAPPDAGRPPVTSPLPLPLPQLSAAQPGSNAGLLFFFILVVQLNDVLQYGWGKLLGRHVIAASINASRTWEGFIGGVLTTMLIGSLLYWVTPFQPWEAACMAGAVAIMGSAGSLVMSAIKRDRGVTDYGTLIQGHAGVLDRLDSMCFAAPIFFHLTRAFFSI